MSIRNDDELPRIMLDEEDRRGYQQKGKPSTAGTESVSSPSVAPAPTSGGGSGLAVFALLLALGAGGAAGYLYTQLQAQLATAQAAEARIADLENRLSATGEEMGESTVALQVKVSELSNRAEELWDQMDKLWASAWRRNQKEIGDLGTKLDEQVASLRSTANSANQTANNNKTSLNSMTTQLESVASEMLAINVQLERLSATNGETNRDLQSTTEKLRLLEQRNAALVTRIGQIETEIRDLATRMASGGATP
ncbi:hypothetical protein [Alteromonas facilis]|uniref:hypothetical protein n=1 Tax=Alteromonas facilis TaxID=2048004 RepID=UPI000C2899EE|nr:hypothetical protein [Alteromonas facilis]